MCVNMSENSVILLTACINPNGMSFTKLQDSEIRRSQYERALDFYLNKTNLKIVFAENTNTYIGDKYQSYINEKRLEFITFEGNNYLRGLGKGYGEALIIKYAIEHSELMRQSQQIIKISGRHLVRNIGTLISLFYDENTVYANIVRCSKTKYYCQSDFFIAPLSFFNILFLPRIEEIDDSKGFFFESLLYDCTKAWRKMDKSYKEFLIPIIVSGQSGTTGENIENPNFIYLRHIVKLILHRWRNL